MKYLAEIKWKVGYRNMAVNYGGMGAEDMIDGFSICFILSARKKGMSSCELAGANCQTNRADGFTVGKGVGQPECAKGDRKIIIVGLEKMKRNQKMGGAYARCIKAHG